MKKLVLALASFLKHPLQLVQFFLVNIGGIKVVVLVVYALSTQDPGVVVQDALQDLRLRRMRGSPPTEGHQLRCRGNHPEGVAVAQWRQAARSTVAFKGEKLPSMCQELLANWSRDPQESR